MYVSRELVKIIPIAECCCYAFKIYLLRHLLSYVCIFDILLTQYYTFKINIYSNVYPTAFMTLFSYSLLLFSSYFSSSSNVNILSFYNVSIEYFHQ